MTSTIIVCLFAGAALIVGYLSIYFLGSNNPVEQECEQIIKDETGATINFGTTTPTPQQPIAPPTQNQPKSS